MKLRTRQGLKTLIRSSLHEYIEARSVGFCAFLTFREEIFNRAVITIHDGNNPEATLYKYLSLHLY